ncbi:NAD-dependent epimerase/dehydratase family protein [Lacibacter luteus]|uniref:NAD-dependent epimerase/dehydratase family protein n=1 Tax=Lacibacter luteus TaxID=2508719 RepID=A0A4Q1CLB1_9BACT|nr:NAD-dependent epimerase/dehydratase family protein [Lacibacter luteus]RXK61475.1 NAD-dependent epimerase/dehydratase family protein [Lacibacter luteus]
MRILITGATGLLGSNLVRLLVERGYSVGVFIHTRSYTKTLQNLPIKKHFGDILDPESVEAAVQEYNVVIHAAAITEFWPSRSKKIREVNIEGTRNVVEAVKKFNIQRLIYIGSGSSVNAPDDHPEKYELSFIGAKYGLDYVDSKYIALRYVLEKARQDGLPALAILPTFMIGPYDSLPSSGKLILALAKRKLKFYSGGGRNFVHVRDVATAIANSIEKGRVGKYYVAGNENMTYSEFFEKVTNIVGVQPPQYKLSDRVIQLAGFLSGLSSELMGNKPILSYPTAKIACDKLYVDCNDTIEELDMPQTPIETAITECYDWLNKNEHLIQSPTF